MIVGTEWLVEAAGSHMDCLLKVIVWLKDQSQQEDFDREPVFPKCRPVADVHGALVGLPRHVDPYCVYALLRHKFVRGDVRRLLRLAGRVANHHGHPADLTQ